MTNYERITNMTIKELSNFLKDIINCKYCPVGSKNCHDFCNNEIERWLDSDQKESEKK